MVRCLSNRCQAHGTRKRKIEAFALQLRLFGAKDKEVIARRKLNLAASSDVGIH